MPEQFTPVTMTDGAGVPLDRNYFNRLEAAHELADDRATALELGIAAPITLTYAATITPDATLGSHFRCVATGNLTLNSPTGGVDGQTVTVRIKASGGTRTVSFEGGIAAATVTSGQWWTGKLTYNQLDDTWILED
jgi:hypothetical protein